jgi:hypothetical protein
LNKREGSEGRNLVEDGVEEVMCDDDAVGGE